MTTEEYQDIIMDATKVAMQSQLPMVVVLGVLEVAKSAANQAKGIEVLRETLSEFAKQESGGFSE